MVMASDCYCLNPSVDLKRQNKGKDIGKICSLTDYVLSKLDYLMEI